MPIFKNFAKFQKKTAMDSFVVVKSRCLVAFKFTKVEPHYSYLPWNDGYYILTYFLK